LRERDDILADAREKDELLARGVRQGWLHGFPPAIKDLAPTKSLRTMLGSPPHHDWVPNRDAQFVKQLKQSGADRWMEVVIYATLAGCPAINVPAGFSAEGLPMGLQIFARPRRDQACLQLVHGYEQATHWTSIRPLEAFSWGGDINDCACA